MIDAIGKACLSSWPNKVLTGLSNNNSNFVLVFRDVFDSSGRIYQEYKRSPHGGRESLIEELMTTTVWGLGIPFGKKAVDWFAPKLSSNYLLPNLDLRLLNQDNPQRLSPKIIEKYFMHPSQSLKSGIDPNLAREQLVKMAKSEGKALINKNRLFQFAKVSGVGLAASVFLGFGVPRLNQHLTRLFLDKEQAKKPQAEKPNEQALQQTGLKPWSSTHFQTSDTHQRAYPMVNPFTAPAISNYGYQPFGANSVNHFNTGAQANTSASNQALRFGGLGKLSAGSLLQKLQENDQFGTLIFSDLPLSTGRVVTARNTDERIEKLFKEGGLILTLFVIQQKLEHFLAGKSQEIGYPALQGLFKKFGNNADQFKKDYGTVKQRLGIDKNTSLAAYFDAAKDKPELIKKQIKQIRDYFNTYSKQAGKLPNLLFDAAEASGKIPTIALKGKNLKHIDITNQIDMDGVKAVAHYLDGLALKKGSHLRKQLFQTTAHKFGAFAGSLMVCWGIMSYAIPKIQHYITFVRTGKNYFPGVESKGG